MARKALIVKHALAVKFSTRAYTRCQSCSRPKAVYRRFLLCRICFRMFAHKGQIPGVKKASW